MPQCSLIWVEPVWNSLGFMDLDVYFSSQVWDIFSHFCSEYTFCPVLSSGIPIMWILFLLIMFHKSYRLYSLFFLFLSVWSSDWVILCVLFSRSLILSSAWLSLFLKFFTEFFSSVLVFFSARISFWLLDDCCFLI